MPSRMRASSTVLNLLQTRASLSWLVSLTDLSSNAFAILPTILLHLEETGSCLPPGVTVTIDRRLPLRDFVIVTRAEALLHFPWKALRGTFWPTFSTLAKFMHPPAKGVSHCCFFLHKVHEVFAHDLIARRFTVISCHPHDLPAMTFTSYLKHSREERHANGKPFSYDFWRACSNLFLFVLDLRASVWPDRQAVRLLWAVRTSAVSSTSTSAARHTIGAVWRLSHLQSLFSMFLGNWVGDLCHTVSSLMPFGCGCLWLGI